MSGGAVNYICRSCRYALKTRRLILSQQTQSRAFSNTLQNAKTLATFTPTSSPELDALLTTWRNEVFLPSILPPHHRALVYKKSRHDILTTPPGVTVTVQTAPPPLAQNATKAGDEDFKLLPMNAFERPNKQKSLQQICAYLGSTTDTAAWDNIIPFLEGMRTARYNVPDTFLETLTRRANAVKQWNTILRAAAMAKRTGLRLSKREVTKTLLIDIHRRSIAGFYKSTEPAKTLDRIVLLLEDEEHCRSLSQKDFEQGHKDTRRDPLLLASLVEQASAASLVHHGGQDHGHKVADAVVKLLAMANTLPGGVIGYLEKENESKLSTFVLEELALVSNALTLAGEVDLSKSRGKERHHQTSIDLQEQLKKINARIEVLKPQVEAEASGKPRRSLEILNGIAKVQKDLL